MIKLYKDGKFYEIDEKLLKSKKEKFDIMVAWLKKFDSQFKNKNPQVLMKKELEKLEEDVKVLSEIEFKWWNVEKCRIFKTSRSNTWFWYIPKWKRNWRVLDLDDIENIKIIN